MDSDAFARAAEAAAARYAPAGRFAAGTARGKLRFDPVYRALLERGIADAASVTDLGCGRGYLLALILKAAPERVRRSLCGVDVARGDLDLARLACGNAASIVEADLATAEVPRSEAVALLDVLHYLTHAAQDALIARACAALTPGGRLFIREVDAGAGPGFLTVRLSERLAALARGEGFRPFAFRRADELIRRVESCGTSVTLHPMGAGTPFANVLLEARRLA